jgi:protein involved in polysaccharide export with SLBB domain
MLRPNRTTAWVSLLSLILTQLSAVGVAQAAPRARVATETPSDTSTDSGPGDSDPATELAPGFLLQLGSPQDSKLNGTFRIQANGRVDLPYSVSLNTKGLTLGKFRAEIARAYAGYFKGAHTVQATIKQKRYWVEVLGLVARPGEYLVKHDSPLDEIISQAGGITEDLATGFVRIVQGKKTVWIDLAEYYKGHTTDVPVWTGADRIFFQKERPDLGADPLDAEAVRKVQVIGEVRNPGELTYRKEGDIYYYLVKTGGPTSYSDLEQVEVIRTDRESGKRKQLSLGPVSEVGSVQGGDILLFHPQRTSHFERTIAITSIITSIVTATLLTIITVRQQSK